MKSPLFIIRSALVVGVALLAGCVTSPTVDGRGSRIPKGGDSPSTQPGRPKGGGPVRGPATAGPVRSDGVIYPVWFGTNRKPVPKQNGHEFTAESYHRTTHGRVEVFVP